MYALISYVYKCYKFKRNWNMRRLFLCNLNVFVILCEEEKIKFKLPLMGGRRHQTFCPDNNEVALKGERGINKSYHACGVSSMRPVSTCLEVWNYITELTWQSTPTRILQLVGLKADRPPTKQADQRKEDRPCGYTWPHFPLKNNRFHR